jgi:LmbE family N-acetylglucosaminyl deacetylase
MDLEYVICISPHSDDAILSCGGFLARASARGRPAHVLTVFAGDSPPPDELTPFARKLHHEWGDLHNPMVRRRAEDARAIASLGCIGATWHYRDAIYRHPASDSAEHLFGPPAEETALEDELQARCAELPAALFLFPLAVGRHVDHQLLFRVGWKLWAMGLPVRFYEDMPYVAWESGPALRLAELGRPLWPRIIDITPYWPAKTDAISCYPSQSSSLMHEGVSLEAAVAHYAAALRPFGYAERLWGARYRGRLLRSSSP